MLQKLQECTLIDLTVGTGIRWLHCFLFSLIFLISLWTYLVVLGRLHTCSIPYPENESINTYWYCVECKLRCDKITINISFNSQGFYSCWCYYSFSGNFFHSSKYIPQTPSLFTKLNFHESVWLRSRQNRRSQVISKNQEMCGGWQQGLRCLAVEIKVQIDSPSWSLSVIDLFAWALLMLCIQTNRVWITAVLQSEPCNRSL